MFFIRIYNYVITKSFVLVFVLKHTVKLIRKHLQQITVLHTI